MKQITINEIKFELKKSINHVPHYTIRNLSDCYNKPSIYKERIYEQWLDFYNTLPYEQQFYYPSIRSFNCNIFTLEMIVIYNNKLHYLVITPSHNYAYPIESEVK